jgi:hypothetical protein
MLTRAPFPSYGTDSNKLVQRMTAKEVEDLGKIGTSGSFIYGIEPFLHVFCHHVSAAENETRR